MRMEVGANDILAILQRQLSSFWDVDLSGYLRIKEKITTALSRTDAGWGASNAKYYVKEGFSPYNSAEYSVFLYYLAHEVGKISGGVSWRISFII